jgi:hypothetical protein
MVSVVAWAIAGAARLRTQTNIPGAQQPTVPDIFDPGGRSLTEMRATENSADGEQTRDSRSPRIRKQTSHAIQHISAVDDLLARRAREAGKNDEEKRHPPGPYQAGKV